MVVGLVVAMGCQLRRDRNDRVVGPRDSRGEGLGFTPLGNLFLEHGVAGLIEKERTKKGVEYMPISEISMNYCYVIS